MHSSFRLWSCWRSLYCRHRRKTVNGGVATANNTNTTSMSSTTGTPRMRLIQEPNILERAATPVLHFILLGMLGGNWRCPIPLANIVPCRNSGVE